MVVGRNEVLELHLLKLARAKDVISRGDLIAKGFSYLRDTEGDLHQGRVVGMGEWMDGWMEVEYLHPRGSLHICKVSEYPLR